MNNAIRIVYEISGTENIDKYVKKKLNHLLKSYQRENSK